MYKQKKTHIHKVILKAPAYNVQRRQKTDLRLDPGAVEPGISMLWREILHSVIHARIIYVSDSDLDQTEDLQTTYTCIQRTK